jgi:hypothetical protein
LAVPEEGGPVYDRVQYISAEEACCRLT